MSIRKMPSWQIPSSLSQVSPVVFVLFSSKATNLSLAFHLSQDPDHKSPGVFLPRDGAAAWVEPPALRLSVCHNVSVSHSLSWGSVSCPQPPHHHHHTLFLLLFTSWMSHSVSTSPCLSSLCFSLWQPRTLWLSTHPAQTVPLLLCAGITDSFCTLSGRQSSCSKLLPLDSLWLLPLLCLMLQLKEESTQTTTSSSSTVRKVSTVLQ